MPNIQKLGLSIDTSSVTEATAALQALAAAVERATKALDALGSKEHGGVQINLACTCSLATVDIKPAA